MAKHVINNPGGRKRLPEKEKYGNSISIRYKPDQLLRIKRKAKKADKSLREYIRESSLHCIVRARITKDQLKEIRDLNNLGNNINTIARTAYRQGLMEIEKEALTALKGVNSVLHQSRLAIKENEPEDEQFLDI